MMTVQPVVTTTTTALWHVHETTTKTKTKTEKTGRHKGTATITTVSTETTTTTALDTTTTTESETTTTTTLDTTTTTAYETTTTAFATTTTVTANAPIATDDMELEAVDVPVDDAAFTNDAGITDAAGSTDDDVITEDAATDEAVTDDATSTDDSSSADDAASTDVAEPEDAATSDAFLILDLDASDASDLVTDPSDTTVTEDTLNIDNTEPEPGAWFVTDVEVLERRDARAPYPEECDPVDYKVAERVDVQGAPETSATEELGNQYRLRTATFPKAPSDAMRYSSSRPPKRYDEDVEPPRRFGRGNFREEKVDHEEPKKPEQLIPHPPVWPNHPRDHRPRPLSALVERQRAAAARAPYPWESDPVDYQEGERVDIQGAPETSPAEEVENQKPKAPFPPKRPSDAPKDRLSRPPSDPRADWTRPAATRNLPHPERPYPPYPHHPPAEVMFPMWEPEWIKYDSDNFVLEENTDTLTRSDNRKRELESEDSGEGVYEASRFIADMNLRRLKKRGLKIKNAEEYLGKSENQADVKAWDNNGPMSFSSDLLGMSPPGSLVKGAGRARKPKKDKKRKKSRFNIRKRL
ncbi:Protein of unknown function [Pyronema omphalodes CBS 100304]|uniref:Uncharacterized protein n=1 Tax=Pyronema omphalodes (strain CBS 100304) TaxID=1076935 RepID=U4L167_PYROM|nr:Protein of unknown function [Pyronema omphalodes CBS 100304]